MSAIRSTPAKSVDAYLKLVPEAMRVALQKLRKIIKAAARPRQLSSVPDLFQAWQASSRRACDEACQGTHRREREKRKSEAV